MPRPFRETRTDRFAELLAQGCTVRVASERMGIKYEYGKTILRRIRKSLVINGEISDVAP